MRKLKSAFTMIELIFVIVILGILAAVAVPKLVATRDDAKVAKMAQNIMTGAGEIVSYSVSQGNTTTDLSTMSNGIAFLRDSGVATLSPGTAVIEVGSVSDCVTVQVTSGITDENLTISFGTPGSDAKCLGVQNAIDARQYPIKLRGSFVKH